MRTITTCVVVSLVVTASVALAQTPPDTVVGVLRLQRVVENAGPALGQRIWPGFRPDTVPVLWVIPHRAKLLAQWRYQLPAGFQPLPGVPHAGWTDTQTVSFPSGRFLSFMSVDSTQDASELVGTAIHEAFHSFERAVSHENRRFGRGENSMLIADYPVFDVDNEAAFALEGHLLRRAYQAQDAATVRVRVAEFLAVRARRHARLDSAAAEFETMAELHEGMAQYTLLRGVAELGTLNGEPWRSGARRLAARETGLLDSLILLTRRSVRRRFYATGATQALLLDRLAGESWKQRLMDNDMTLEEALTTALGSGSGARTATQWDAWYRTEVARRHHDAERAVDALHAVRQAQVDSLMARAGLRVEIVAPAGRLQWCGFDPQNALQIGNGRMLHLRFLNVCGSGGLSVEFEMPVVENRETGVYQLIVPADSLSMTSEGKAILINSGESQDLHSLKIRAPGFNLEAARARVSRDAAGLRIVLVG